MEGLLYSTQQEANVAQQDIYQRGVLAEKWPNGTVNYSTVFPRRNDTQYFIIINAADFDLLTPEELTQLVDIQNDWYIKPTLNI